MDDYDAFFIKRCFQLAKNGLGNVSPNPMVGCVLTAEGKIIGEGYHQIYGGPHAEPNAISNVRDKSLLSEATLYVNLEPCVHFGKTPPCTSLIIEKGIKNVVICNIDPHPKVSGNGVKILREAGTHVRTGILENEGKDLNRRFFTFFSQKRPYIILKWAQTLDGFMDIERYGDHPANYWITNKQLKVLVHKWRSEEDAVMAGTNTIHYDNPFLTVREWTGKNPVRIIIDKNLRLDENRHVFNTDAATLVYTSEQIPSKNNISFIKIDFSNMMADMMTDLYQRGIQSVIVEGGREFLSAFISSNLWDEARVLIGNKVFVKGLKAPEFPFNPASITSIDEDRLLFYRNSSF